MQIDFDFIFRFANWLGLSEIRQILMRWLSIGAPFEWGKNRLGADWMTDSEWRGAIWNGYRWFISVSMNAAWMGWWVCWAEWAERAEGIISMRRKRWRWIEWHLIAIGNLPVSRCPSNTNIPMRLWRERAKKNSIIFQRKSQFKCKHSKWPRYNIAEWKKSSESLSPKLSKLCRPFFRNAESYIFTIN